MNTLNNVIIKMDYIYIYINYYSIDAKYSSNNSFEIA